MTVRILTGDCREVLKGLPDESVNEVVTSPLMDPEQRAATSDSSQDDDLQKERADG